MNKNEVSRLTVKGKNIINEKGEIISLRGINFGSWLMMETWIPKIEEEGPEHLIRLAAKQNLAEQMKKAIKTVGDFDDDSEHINDYINRMNIEFSRLVTSGEYEQYSERFAKETPVVDALSMDKLMKERWGDKGAEEIWTAFHDTWITEKDFHLARELGFNFVRLPFWYRWFESDENPYEYSEYGFNYLDKAIEWAAKYGIYILLDFHGAAGGQSPWSHTGEYSRNELFKNTDFMDRTAALWKAIAERYKDDNTVWGYDLLNEPWGAESLEGWTAHHDFLYKTIRSVDPDKIIVMEDGYKLEDEPFKSEGFFPDPIETGWKNLVYSFHFYSGSDPMDSTKNDKKNHERRADEVISIGSREQERTGVPLYVGEFSTMSDTPNEVEGMRMFCSRFNEKGWHWSPWTWKYVNSIENGSLWGVYQHDIKHERFPDFNNDSKESILEYISKLSIDNFSVHEGYGEVLKDVLR